MTFKVAGFAAIALCTSMAAHAAANDDVSSADVADKFVDALRHQRFKDAAAMFAPEVTRDKVATELTLQRIDDSLGGFPTIHPVATLPDGRTIKLAVPAHNNTASKAQKFVQVRYASTASDGKPVFYEVDLTTDNRPPQVLSFEIHFPVSDAQSTQRATQHVSAINR